jgi:cytoskeletal protein RodZ
MFKKTIICALTLIFIAVLVTSCGDKKEQPTVVSSEVSLEVESVIDVVAEPETPQTTTPEVTTITTTTVTTTVQETTTTTTKQKAKEVTTTTKKKVAATTTKAVVTTKKPVATTTKKPETTTKKPSTTTKSKSKAWGSISQMTSDSKSYALSAGFKWDSSLNKSNSHWVTPVSSLGFNSPSAFKSKVNERTDFLKSQGYEFIRIYFEQNGDKISVYHFVG